ncbi:MAG TPA: TrkH family potassium uptake protein [Phycisphaerae bacterium]|nr:TrkH family potassium uptake protein [Phycisphaerae bacterium]HDZ43405.1 TrkH family potassium uptake protein [Phycisphaerae bacterium]
MRFGTVLFLVGALAILLGVNMLPAVAWGVYFGEHQAIGSLLASMGISLVLGITLMVIFRGKRADVGPREGFAVAALSWIVLAGLGALPFFIGGHIPSYIDAYFETMSGLTTTGASILTSGGGAERTDIESLPQCLLFWRSYTHWLGGMGIIVLSLALLPMLGVGGMQIYRAEVPGPTADKLVPRVRQTTKLLWGIYVLLSLAQCVLLWVHPNVSLFDAMCHTFGTMATGGFSTHSASIKYFDSAYVDVVIIVFMVLAGTNFALHYAGLHGRLKAYLKNGEFMFYVGVLAGAVLLVWAVMASRMGVGGALRRAAFQVVSITTTTGYTTANFDVWPVMVRLGLVVLMFFGGCAGSTGGGIKHVRVLLLIKHAGIELRRLLHPQAILPVRLNGRPVKDRVIQSIQAFVVLYIGIFVVASIVMTGVLLIWPASMAPDGQEVTSDTVMVTAVSSVAATLNNIGPGLGHVGPGEIRGYSWVPPVGKIVLTFCMLIGRLEVFTVLLLFVPWFYR